LAAAGDGAVIDSRPAGDGGVARVAGRL